MKMPIHSCKQTFRLEASHMQTVASPGDQAEYWRKHQHATWVNVLEENPNTDGCTTLYRSTPDSTTLCTAVLTEVTGPTHRIRKMTTLTLQTEDRTKVFCGCCFTGHALNTWRGRGFSFNLPWLVSTSAMLPLQRNTEVLSQHSSFNWWQLWLLNPPCVSGAPC